MNGGGTGRASPLFIHSFQAVLCNVPVDNGRKDKPLRGKTSRCAFGGRAAHPLPIHSLLVFLRHHRILCPAGLNCAVAEY